MSPVTLHMHTADLIRSRSASEAVGEEATWIGQQLDSMIHDDVDTVMSVGWSRSEAMRDLMRIREECSLPGWDGFGAAALDLDSWARAVRLILDLPIDLPVPEVSIDPDGEIAFDWNLGQRRALSASVGGEGRFTYATIAGAAEASGNEYYASGFPSTLLEGLRRILPAEIRA